MFKCYNQSKIENDLLKCDQCNLPKLFALNVYLKLEKKLSINALNVRYAQEIIAYQMVGLL